jgi:multidrug efflux pump subunit AcrA (membrane-fusion protein)
MFVQVRLVVEPKATAVVVPREAIYTVAGLAKLFVIRDGRAVEKRVLLGEKFDGWIEVRDGAVAPGELVALDHVAELVNGAAVKIGQGARQGG